MIRVVNDFRLDFLDGDRLRDIGGLQGRSFLIFMENINPPILGGAIF